MVLEKAIRPGKLLSPSRWSTQGLRNTSLTPPQTSPRSPPDRHATAHDAAPWVCHLACRTLRYVSSEGTSAAHVVFATQRPLPLNPTNARGHRTSHTSRTTAAPLEPPPEAPEAPEEARAQAAEAGRGNDERKTTPRRKQAGRENGRGRQGRGRERDEEGAGDRRKEDGTEAGGRNGGRKETAEEKGAKRQQQPEAKETGLARRRHSPRARKASESAKGQSRGQPGSGRRASPQACR